MTVVGNSGSFGFDALAALKVVEFGEGVAAAHTAKLFADYGASVIKVERPQGDPIRRRGPFPKSGSDASTSGLFAYLNTNKLGVCLDVATPTGASKLGDLLSKADIFVTDVATDVLRLAGCEPDYLRKQFPTLIIVSISPFGRNGPLSGWVGDELIAYAASGFAYGTPGIPDAAEDLDKEPPLHPSCFVAETIAGVAAAIGAMSAVHGRRRTGQGCYIDLAIQAASAAVQIRDVMPSSYGGARYNRVLNPTSIGRMPNFYLPCKDGYVTIAAPMDIHWKRLVEAMGQPAWALDERYSTEPARMKNWVELRRNLAAWAATCTGSELEELGDKYGIMLFPFYSVRRMAQSEHVQTRSALVEVAIGREKMQMPGAPFKMSRTPWALRKPAPGLGEHNGVVFGEELNA